MGYNIVNILPNGGNAVKAYANRVSGASTVTRYTIMNITEACACAAMLFGKVSRHVSDHRLILLVILFNVVAIGARGIVSLAADRATHARHSGVRLGVLLFALGFLWPVEFGITLKVILTAVGSAVYHAFAASSIQAKSAFRSSGMGFLAAGAVLGTAIGRYASFYGYLCIIFFMILACPTDKCANLPEAKEDRLVKAPKTVFSPLFVLLLLVSVGALSYAISSFDFAWDVNRKTMLLIALAMAFGRGLGGLVTDLLGHTVTVAASLGGGTALLLFCADSKLLSLGGIALISMAAAPLLSLLFRCMPCHPGFSVSLATGMAYLGYVALKYYPIREGLLPLISGIALLIAVGTDLFLYFMGRRAQACKEVSDHA